MSEEEFNIRDQLLDPQAKWLKSQLTRPDEIKTSSLQKFGKAAGLVCGGISSFITGPLGYSFGLYVAELINIDDPTSKSVVGFYFGGTAAFALIALQARISSNTWEQLLETTPDYKKALQEKACDGGKVAEYSYLAMVVTTGAISATPTVYITEEYFSKYIGYGSLVFDAATFLSLATARSWSLDKMLRGLFSPLINKALNKLSSEEKKLIEEIRAGLIQQLEKTINIVKTFNPTEVDQFWHDTYLTASNEDDSSAEIDEEFLLNKIRKVFHPISQSVADRKAIAPLKKFPKKRRICRTIY
ncbi:MAG TPA: hypothetical protein VG895_05640 [Patescibacteria group bacterium]|nr:hypothetical protein [Gammaproteobacteria bacterium]HWA52497.1 hypothetical protein [Patescibacteria group bacterium]